MNKSAILFIVVTAVICLVVGSTFGSIVLPVTKTQTTTIYTSYPYVSYSGTTPFLFQLRVNYSGSWKGWVANYTTLAGQVTNKTWSNSENSSTITYQVYTQGTVCASVQKEDDSSGNLTLMIGVYLGNSGDKRTNSTTLPYGSVKLCESAAL